MALFPLLVIAAAFWGQSPSCGQPAIATADLLPPIVGEADLTRCAIRLDRRTLVAPGQACMVVLHEYGHLLGLNHSADPDSVMYPLMRKPAWPCAW